MKVMLITYSGKAAHPDNFMPDNGLAVLAACIEEKGHECIIYDYNKPIVINKRFNLTILKNKIINDINKEKPDLLGFKVFMNGFFDIIYIAKAIKEKFSDITIIAGGPQISYFEDKIFSVTNVFDILIYGEGEKTIMGILDYFRGRIPIEKIPGIIYKKADRIIKINKDVFNNLDKIPLPLWDAYKDLKKFWPIITFSMIRGCPNKCAFCIHPYLWGNKIRRRSINNVIQEIKFVDDKYGINTFRLADSTPMPNLLHEFSKTVIDNNLDITWSSFGHVKAINEKSLRIMKEAGCIAVWYGLESGNNDILKGMNKNFIVQEVEEVCTINKMIKLPFMFSVIIGFPGENEETIQDTINIIKRIKPNSIMITPLGIFPHTQLANNPIKYNISLSHDWEKSLMNVRFESLKEKSISNITDYFSVNNKSLSYWIKKAEIVAKKLEDEGILVQITDDIFLMARSTKYSLIGFINKIRKAFINGDNLMVEKLISKSWN